MRTQRIWVILAIATFLAACTGDDLGPNISGVNAIGIVSVRVSPGLDTIFIPDTVRTTDRVLLHAEAFSRTGLPIGGMAFVWSSSDQSVATVDGSGVVTPVRPGTVTVSASAGKVGHANVVVLPATNMILVSPGVDTVLSNDPEIPPRDTARFTATAYDAAGHVLTGVAFDWQSSATANATVDAAGLARAVAPGTPDITVSANGLQAAARLVVLNATQDVTVAPALDTIFVDEPIVSATMTKAFTATAHDPYGGVLTRAQFTWQSSAPNVATVDASGVAHAVTLGGATLTVQSGGRQGTATVQVVPAVKTVQASTPVLQVLARDTVQLTATAFDYSNQPMSGRAFTWTSSQPAIATVSSTGQVIFLAAGTATFTARSAFRTDAVTITAFERKLLSLDTGGDFTCGLAPLGRGYCWGVNSVGQLAPASGPDSTCFNDGGAPGAPVGNWVAPGATAPCHLPPIRMQQPEVAFTQISSGGAFACGVTADGSVYCWGDGRAGQCGNGSTSCGPVPLLASVRSEHFTRVTVGGAHACALNFTGNAYCWGADTTGQLGDTLAVQALTGLNSTTPIPVRERSGAIFRPLIAISAGDRHTCGIDTNGAAFCWGDGSRGQRGDNGTQTSELPIAVAGNMVFTAISAGGHHTCGITSTGAAWCWGDNIFGQLGNGVVGGFSSAPVLVNGGRTYVAISAGEATTCAIATGGGVYCWGNNSYAQLGIGAVGGSGAVSSPLPVLQPGSGSVNFTATSISVGLRHTCAIGTDTQAYCWGSNVFGALGNELQAASRERPELVAVPR